MIMYNKTINFNELTKTRGNKDKQPWRPHSLLTQLQANLVYNLEYKSYIVEHFQKVLQFYFV